MSADRSYSKKLSLEKIKESLKLFFAFNSYLSRYWKAELAIIASEALAIILLLLNPYLGKIILDNGILGKDIVVFLKVTFISVAVYLLSQATEKINLWLKGYLARKIRVDLARKALRKTGKLSLESFRSASTSESVSRLNTDIAISSGVIGGTLSDLVKVILRIVLITVIIFFINAKILFLILIYQSIVLAQANFFAAKFDELARDSYSKSHEMGKVLTQVFSHLYFVKASGKMAAMMKRYFRAFAENMRVEVKSTRFDFLSGILSDLSGKIFFGIIGFIGTILVIKGQLTLGGLTAILAYMAQGTGAYTSLVNLCQRMILNRLPLARVAELLDTRIDIKESPGAIDLDLSTPKIEFRGVSFAYTRSGRILEKIDFLIMPGDKIALVGLSGCGKTTIVNLILRLYDVNTGGILLNDCDVRDVRFKSIYDQIALAPQSPHLSGDTIRNNITYGSREIDYANVNRAARIAEIHSFIETLSAKYDTVLSDMVEQISQGQKQRIAIARAVAKNPRILILDEACSSLDSKTEEKIMDNIKEEFPNTTLIVITHRLSTVKKMDRVYFLKSAHEISVSTHAVLSEIDSRYNELFAGQMEERDFAARQV